MPTTPPDLGSAGQVRDLLRRHHLTPDKGYGQNFLVDRAALRAVVDAGDPGPDDVVLEVGPGLGALTRALAERAGRVLALELDGRLLPALRETTESLPNVEVRRADAVRFDHAEMPQGALLVSNLPYQVATAVVGAALASGRYRRLAVLVQREVAERMAARPNDPAFGAFSLVCRHWAEVRVVRHVAPGAFLPPPKVASSIVRFDVRSDARDRPELFALIRSGFRHRRKTLRKNLTAAGIDAAAVVRSLDALGRDPMVRAEALELEEWERLATELGVAPPYGMLAGARARSLRRSNGEGSDG